MTTAPIQVRGGGYGLDADLAKKAAEKYDPQLEAAVQQWMEAVLHEPFPEGFSASLKDGQRLCRLINAIKPNSVKKIETSKLPFKQMENISKFLQACRAIGLQEFELFETVDLYEEKDLGLVVRCMVAVSRTAKSSVAEFPGPFLGGGVARSPRSQAALEAAAPKAPINQEEKAPLPPVPPKPKSAPSAPTAAGPCVPPNIPSPCPFNTHKESAEVNSKAPNFKARGGGYGLDVELAEAREAKYDVNLEKEVRRWIEAVLGAPLPEGTLGEVLHDGQLLCQFMNNIKPGSIKKVETSKLAYKQMENISKFLQVCRSVGVPEFDLFETVDLYEQKDMGLVVRCLDALGRTIQRTVPEYTGPQFGVKLASENKRVFTEEQLAESRGVQSKLMMGSGGIMERLPVNAAKSITFGAENAGVGSNVISKISQGSVGIMERLPVNASKSITFGAENAGTGSNVISKIAQGSVGIMERLPINASNSVTFGAEQSGTGSDVISKQTEGSGTIMERSHVDCSRNVNFGAQNSSTYFF